ncbi:MAG: hypothetical protein IJ796_10640, partial [Lachnospiraceae bacterium]|nr:hypothetical protein [Lachnospiraceae bacterium]
MKKNETRQNRISPPRGLRQAPENRGKRKKIIRAVLMGVATVLTAAISLLFLMPIILTITNSFMSPTEFAANYGAIYATTKSGGRQFVAELVNLKFIPDMVSFSQYSTVLFR